MTLPGHGDAVAESSTPHERASATPIARARLPRPESTPEPVATSPLPIHPSLQEQQAWFTRAVTTPETEPIPAGASEVDHRLTAGPRLTAIERLEVYRSGYHARLIECLADDYPALREAIGENAFDDLGRAYILRHPSMGPNLNSFGRKMADFCRTEIPELAHREFAADLATLEWAIVEVIHAQSSQPLTVDGLVGIPVDRWAEARLVPTPAFRLLQFRYPINAYFQSFRDSAGLPIPAPQDSAALVYRSGPTVWRMSLTPPMFELLSAIAAGESLGASVERAAAVFTEVTEEVAAARMMVWFRDWVASGLFAAIDFG